MMLFLSFYLPLLLSLSLSFLLHAFKKHIHSFFSLSTTTFKLHKKCLPPNSHTATTAHVLPPPPPPPIELKENTGAGIERLTTCTESLGFESFDIENDDGDNGIINRSDDGDCWRKRAGAALEGRGEEPFPPPLSSLNGNGRPSFVLLPMRENGRLQLSRVRVKRPEILCATREDGRLRLYLVPDDECSADDDVELEECEDDEEIEEVEDEDEEETEEEEEVVEMISRYYEEDEEEEEEDRVREWEFPAARGNEWFRRCHQVVHHIQYHHHVHSSHHHHLHNMYGVGIA